MYEKYQRRVKRFLEMVRKPTCLIRLCWSASELSAIAENEERITNTDYSTISYPDKVSIYGCGAIGRTLYQHIRDRVKVVEFIDRTPRQDFYDSVPVVTCKNAKSDRDTQIIIVPSYAYDEIVHDLTDALGFEPNAVGLEEFLAEGRVLDPNF